MADFPRITTAIPRRRYSFGEYNVTILGGVESPDPATYQFIMAFVEEGGSQPSLFLTCEKARPNQSADGKYMLRIINSALSDVISQSDELGELEIFAAEALEAGRQVLGLTDVHPFQTM